MPALGIQDNEQRERFMHIGDEAQADEQRHNPQIIELLSLLASRIDIRKQLLRIIAEQALPQNHP